ncbi:aminopeptidase P family protein [Parapedobacter koreensis]|uniref:Xaa-Pro aminopeptidase n=1 Tax=Parapedobacter koreensis TaxID=332977 RepID=A0A1H7S5G7_9SPHI|nr:aminopeptidase P family protein [Parapedobacter koreensis]SEL67618.1 Xaa-Pro aminopeptidase [Parapedobacter koreensis]
MTHMEKLAAIRGLMRQQHIDAYIIPSSDPHISEYLPDRYKCMAWASGFTGSAGTLAITQEFAGLWTDSRYFVQAAEQLSGSGYELVKLVVQHAPEYADWLAEQLPKGAVVAFDGMLASVALANTVQDKLMPAGILVKGEVDLLTPLWEDRPALPTAPAYLLDVAVTGESTITKLQRLRQEMARLRVNAHLISSLDDLAWLFNIRGSDVSCNPVVLGFALITATAATLFIDNTKLMAADRAALEAAGVVLADYESVETALRNLDGGNALLIDTKRTCFAMRSRVPDAVTVIAQTNPTTSFKAIKNEVEIAHTRETMIHDGVALTRFFKWLEETIGREPISEISLAMQLRQFRAAQEGFVGESFDTIAGYKAHGALPHYKATPTSNSTLQPDGLLLVDSGGQYRTGTTDITRVISLGHVTDAERTDYTLVLRGMIEGAATLFPKGTRGYQIDAITRKPLWDHLRNYGHGTGHGVGFFLNVHEGPHTFNAAAIDVPIESGMITSIEPGLYREGEYGIRIENLVLSITHQNTLFGSFMAFETMTLCYIDTQLIDKSLLDAKHVNWLNSYHATVYERLAPYLDEQERLWLADKTAII